MHDTILICLETKKLIYYLLFWNIKLKKKLEYGFKINYVEIIIIIMEKIQLNKILPIYIFKNYFKVMTF